MAAVSAPPSTVAELVASLEAQAEALAELVVQALENAARAGRTPRAEHIEADFRLGWLRGICTAIAIATGEDSDDIYHCYRPSTC